MQKLEKYQQKVTFECKAVTFINWQKKIEQRENNPRSPFLQEEVTRLNPSRAFQGRRLGAVAAWHLADMHLSQLIILCFCLLTPESQTEHIGETMTTSSFRASFWE